ncbi:hypothetical protein CTAM01_08725 [Colletotrichum tamarilloi]|uniref:Uncharacterized protein n=1 Tax=Colletotrichum tamarilloi TaxID=1209934 RepID=A0ABQ9R632_9PEZI|nr:uncharacterized protein CTAM01_08725 [Colletotrichum tamarilloi]KAK1495270.1 hypothetical protein CTAM01_08725 [Colletotrichum tamarilloi]
MDRSFSLTCFSSVAVPPNPFCPSQTCICLLFETPLQLRPVATRLTGSFWDKVSMMQLPDDSRLLSVNRIGQTWLNPMTPAISVPWEKMAAQRPSSSSSSSKPHPVPFIVGFP